jgi:hypothetical protein
MLVHTLACEGHVWFAVPCLRSLLTFCEEPVELVIHDDGSLTQRSADLLAAAFPDSILVPRRSADAEMADALAHFPCMAKARMQLPHVLKLTDVTLTRRESALVRYVDTDVLFQKRFRGLFSDPSASAAFLMDYRNSFGAHPADFWPLGPLRLARRLNSGLFWIRRDRIDLERMEYLFKRWGPVRIGRYHGWFEQTVWADQAWRARCSMFDPTQLSTATPADGSNSRLIGVHFVTPRRAMLQAALEAAPFLSGKAPTGDVEDIRLYPSKPYGLSAAVFDAMQAISTRASPGNARRRASAPLEEKN